MAFTTEELRKYPFGPSEKAPVNTTDGLIPWRFMISFAAIVSAAMIGVRVYQQIFAWSAGLDYFEPEFQTYWMTFLYAEWVMEAILATSIWGYIWITRDRHLDQLQPLEELRQRHRPELFQVEAGPFPTHVGEAVDVFINVLGHGDHTCFLGGAVVDANDGMADVLGALDVRPVTGAVVADDGAIATHVDIGFDVASATCADSDA